MGTLWQDLRYSIRMLSKSPGLMTVMVLSLALGIGANTSIFSLIDQILLRRLPVRNPQELILLTARGSHYGNNTGGNALSYPMYQDFKDNEALSSQIFKGLMCRFTTPVSLSFQGQTERASGELVSGNYFQVLGVGAVLGRSFTPDDDRIPGGHPLVVLSYNFWKTRFASDRTVVGKTVIVNGRDMTVLGVSEQSFDGVEFGFSPQVFIPVMMQPLMTPNLNVIQDMLKDRRSRWVNVFGRLKPGVTLAQTKAALQPIFHQILETEVKEAAFRNASPYSREQFLKMTMDVLPGSKGRSFLREQVERPLWVLMAVVFVVLLTACANVASLLIARAMSRQKEISVRLALGASRFRLIRQLLVESLLLSVLGGMVGLIFAIWTNRLLLGFLPQEDSTLNLSSTPDLRILGFTLVASVLTGILFGLVPALRSSRPDLVSSLKDPTGALSGGGGQVRLRKILVVAQVSLSLLLLVGAGLFLRSLRNLKALGTGFPTENLIGFNLDPSLNGYSTERCKLFYQQLIDNLNSVPGVQSAALASVRILENDEWDSTITVEGYEAKPGEDMGPYFNSVSPDYFTTMGIPLLAGRDFTIQDKGMILPHGVPRVVIVNEKLARHYFGGNNPIGRRIGFGGDPGSKADMEIIGVIKDAKYTNLRDEIPRQVFIPYLASPIAGGMTGYVRTTLEPNHVFGTIRAEVKKLDANMPVYAMRTLDSQIDRSLLNERLVASLSTVFGLLATLLSMIGLYGVMAYVVALRTREIGIRRALGAQTSNVIVLVLAQGLKLIVIGQLIGLSAALVLNRVLSSFLFGITPTDPATLVAATLILAAVALLACYIPARRATEIDPMVALRYE